MSSQVTIISPTESQIKHLTRNVSYASDRWVFVCENSVVWSVICRSLCLWWNGYACHFL